MCISFVVIEIDFVRSEYYCFEVKYCKAAFFYYNSVQ